MERIYKNVTELIGHTPLLEITHMKEENKLQARILVKLELFNPAGSVKDRIAKKMLMDAQEKGLIKRGAAIIEPTSGNTGIGLAAVAAANEYRAIFTMPETMSMERRKLLAAYGAEIVLTEGKLGMSGAIAKAEELAKKIPNSIVLGQFVNPANAQAHYETTGPEIWADTDGAVDIFVAGIGTGGTITGTGRYLKEKNMNMQVIGVEPKGSAVLSGEAPGPHGLQGIGAGFVPKVLNTEVYDQMVQVSKEQAYEAARLLAKTEGILTGMSSGAALYAAMEEAKKEKNKGKTIVVILPDTGERYLSTDLY